MTLITVHEALFTLLEANATLVGLVTVDRMYPHRLPTSVTLPALTIQRISGAEVGSHEGTGGPAHPRFQIDCYGSTLSSTLAVASAVKAAIQGYRGVVTTANGSLWVQAVLLEGEHDEEDEEKGMYRTIQEFFIWYSTEEVT